MEPPLSFPAKLTLFLYHRYQYFHGDATKGMYIIPCELLENNGQLLKSIILNTVNNGNYLPTSSLGLMPTINFTIL